MSSVSADGTAAIGRTANAVLARWTAATGVQNLVEVPGAITGINADGSVVVGFSDIGGAIYHAFRWTVGDGFHDLGSFSSGVNNGSFATGVDPSGSIVVGYSYTDPSQAADGQTLAFRWTANDGLRALGTLYPYGTSVAEAISGNGAAVVGTSAGIVNNQLEERAFLWTAATGIRSLGTLTGGPSHGLGTNVDGSVVVGDSQAQDGKLCAVRWTAASGMEDLGAGPSSFAKYVTGDGALIVGSKLDGPFAWTPDYGTQNVNTYLALRGVYLGGVVLVDVQGLSPDGNTIAGSCSSPTTSGECVLTGLRPPVCSN